MNKTIMRVWGLIVVLICGFLVYLGKKDEDKVYKNIEKELLSATKTYVSDKDLMPDVGYSVIINVDELILNDYMEYSDTIDKYCLNNIVVSKGIIDSEYKVKTDCNYNVHDNVILKKEL